MAFAQTVTDLKDVAGTYGLGVAVLIAIVVFFMTVTCIVLRWSAPKADKIINGHLETMAAFKVNSSELATCYRDMAATVKSMNDNLKTANEKQAEDRREVIEMLARIVDSNNGISKVVTNLSCLAGRIEKP